MWIFGSDCYVYKHNQKKLDPRCTKGIFVGYDKNSPAYLVYHPESGKVMKHRLVKFVKKTCAEQYTQTDMSSDDYDVHYREPKHEVEVGAANQDQNSSLPLNPYDVIDDQMVHEREGEEETNSEEVIVENVEETRGRGSPQGI